MYSKPGREYPVRLEKCMEMDHELNKNGQEPEESLPVAVASPVFSHVRFAFLNVFVLFATYHMAGALLGLAVDRLGITGLEAGTQGIAQVLFLLVPSIVLMRYSPLGIRGLLRTEGNVTAMQWTLGLAGVCAILIFNYGWISLQEWIIPHQWMEFYHGFQEQIDQMYGKLLIGESIAGVVLAFVIGAVIPAFSEEVLFRGLMQRSLEQEWSPTASILTTGAIFGAIHLIPTSIVPLALIGIYLGFLAWYTRSLALPMLVHFFNNAISITALNITGQDTTSTAQAVLPPWQAALVALIGLACLLYIVRGILFTPRLLRQPPFSDEGVPVG
jgi:membrane protease YdiL (CAAX protease family)